MTLYNMIMGTYRHADTFLQILNEVEELSIPRFRDCYLSGKSICVVTRTGGGNREEYENDNDLMTQHPLYVSDSDCSGDETYAKFYFRFPDDLKDDLNELVRLQKEAAKKAKAEKAEKTDRESSESPSAPNYTFSQKFRKLFKMS